MMGAAAGIAIGLGLVVYKLWHIAELYVLWRQVAQERKAKELLEDLLGTVEELRAYQDLVEQLVEHKELEGSVHQDQHGRWYVSGVYRASSSPTRIKAA